MIAYVNWKNRELPIVVASVGNVERMAEIRQVADRRKTLAYEEAVNADRRAVGVKRHKRHERVDNVVVRPLIVAAEEVVDEH